MKHTHRGSCQACGRQQAVMINGDIAKHGYTVDWGFFNGTCVGSDNKPLELDKIVSENIIKQLREIVAPRADKRAADLADGTIAPKFFKSVKNDKPRVFGERNYRRFIDVECDRSELSDHVAEQQIRFAIHRAEREANQARVHATMLEKLIVDRFGKPLTRVNHEARKQALKVGANVRIGGAKGWVGEVVELKYKEQRRFSMRPNYPTLHAVVRRAKDGFTVAVPTSTIRQSAIVTEAQS